MKRALLVAIALGACGCTHFFSKVLPMGEPVTQERCEALDMKKIGYKDGEEGQAKGAKFEFWQNDCRSLGVSLNRAAYDQGYGEGAIAYCGCEMGFRNAIHGETLGLKAQYFACPKEQYGSYARGFELAEPLMKDETLVKYETVAKTTYFEEEITRRGKLECAKPIPTVKPAPTATPKPPPEPRSPRPFDPEKKNETSP